MIEVNKKLLLIDPVFHFEINVISYILDTFFYILDTFYILYINIALFIFIQVVFVCLYASIDVDVHLIMIISFCSSMYV